MLCFSKYTKCDTQESQFVLVGSFNFLIPAGTMTTEDFLINGEGTKRYVILKKYETEAYKNVGVEYLEQIGIKITKNHSPSLL